LVAGEPLRAEQSRAHIGAMSLELSDADITILADLLKRTIDDARYPLSPRVTRLREILAKLRPEPVREPLPPRKVYAPPRASAARRRR
jgi:hypothetical protein